MGMSRKEYEENLECSVKISINYSACESIIKTGFKLAEEMIAKKAEEKKANKVEEKEED